jgi:twinkle protein
LGDLTGSSVSIDSTENLSGQFTLTPASDALNPRYTPALRHIISVAVSHLIGCPAFSIMALPDQSDAANWEKALPTHAAAMEYLTGSNRHKNQRGIKPEILKKYGVGVTDWKFATDSGAIETHTAITFPWKRTIPSGDGTEGTKKVVERVKIRSLKDKAYQRMHPKGGKFGFFGLDTVPASAEAIVINRRTHLSCVAY